MTKYCFRFSIRYCSVIKLTLLFGILFCFSFSVLAKEKQIKDAPFKTEYASVLFCFNSDSTISHIDNKIYSGKLRALKEDDWFGSDKKLHFGASALATLSTAYVVSDKFKFDHKSTQIASAGCVLLVGALKEMFDDTHEDNIFSFKDFTADIAGILFGSIIIAIR